MFLTRRLKLPTFAHRRICGDIIETYKLLQGKYENDVLNIVKLHKNSDTMEDTRGHSLKLFLEPACVKVRKESFSFTI